MITVLVDHNIEGQAIMMWGKLSAEGWTDLLSMGLTTFAAVGLADDSSDRVVWRFAQENKMILLTANRQMKGEDSLEQTIREENTMASLPVLTVGNMYRLVETEYREQCATRLLDIVLDLENHLGTGRIFIP